MPSDFDNQLREIFGLLQSYRMPFGKFGPEHFPPSGLHLDELPYEYLRCFERTSYPKGRLGELMKFVHDIKRDGAEEIFVPLRTQRGGPRSQRKPRGGSRHVDLG